MSALHPLVSSLVSRHPIISDQIQLPGLQVVLQNLAEVLDAPDVPGDIAEFGCYVGTTSLFLRRLLDAHPAGIGRQLHVYDSFAGLPPKTEQDRSAAGEAFQAGELAASKKQLLINFQKARLSPPIIHKGWFDDLIPADVPEQLAFAFLDGDFYGSILTSLRLVWPRMQQGGVITVDDYQRQALPGPERAVRHFLQDKQYARLTYANNIAVIRL